MRVAAVPRRPFRGWRYLAAAMRRPTCHQGRETEPDLPAEIARALADMGCARRQGWPEEEGLCPVARCATPPQDILT